jgi:HAMP domain-containing protein/hemerythrin
MAIARQLVWLDDYVVGDERIDAEHKRLLELLFEIEGLIVGKGAAVALKQRISEFLRLLKAHCAYEEGRMQRLSRDRFGDLVDSHFAQHAQLIEKGQSLLDAVGGDEADRARLPEAHKVLLDQMRDLILDDFGLVGAVPDKSPSESQGQERQGDAQEETGAPATIGMYLIAIVGAFLLLALILLGYTIQETTTSIKSEISQSAHAISKGVANEINAILLNNKDVMERMAKRPLMRRATQDECDKILWDFKEIFPRFANVTTIEPDGTALCSAVPQPGGKPVNVFKSEWFQRLIATQSFVVGKPFMGPITGRWVSVLASPVYDDQGTVIRYMGLPLDLVALTPSIAKSSLYEDAVVGVATDDGVIVWRSKDADAWVGKSLKERAAFSNFVDKGINETTIVGIDNIERTYYFDRVEASNWVVWVGVPRDVLKALWLKVLPSLALLGLLGLLFVAAILFLAARRIAKPMRDLADTVRAVQSGDNKARAMLKGPREVVAVAREFNALVELREKQTDELIKSNVELKRFAFIARTIFRNL